MAIILREATDADIPTAMELERAAYAATATASGSILFPGPFPPGRQHRIEQVINMRKEDPKTVFMIAVDEDTHEQIAFSKWSTYKTEDEARAAPPRTIPCGPGLNNEACAAFFGGLARSKIETVGNQPHVYLSMMHTGPQYQKRGAASMLIRWGLQRADELNLPVYLESSLVAHDFYEKHGFKDVNKIEVDLTPFGGPGLVHSAPCMLRDAKFSS